MKKLLLLFPIILTLTSCGEFYPSNAPRQTAASKEVVLTTVTSIETSRPETYSEYISSLHEMESSVREEALKAIGGMERDTAVSREQTEPAETMERVTAVTADPGIEQQTAVTSPPMEEEEQTVTCSAESTGMAIDLSDIPAVPSDRVQADTALTTSEN